MADRLLIAILAAGASRRLGQPKQLVQIDGEPLIHRQGRIAIEANCGEVVVILGAASAACAAAIGDLSVTVRFNPHWQEGIAASLREATRAARERNADGLMIVQVDQYQLTAADLAQVHSAWLASGTDKSCRTRSGDYVGPPVILSRFSFADALQLAGDDGARRILQKLGHDRIVEVELPNAIADLDVPADLAAIADNAASPMQRKD